jgi:tetratricopeptide (TPR) repeat protein
MARKHHQLSGFAILRSLAMIVVFAGGCTMNPYGSDDRSGRGAAIEQDMGSASRSLLEASRAHSESRNYGQAAAALERAIRIEPNQPALWLELGRVSFLEADYKQAEQFGKKARSLAAGDPAAESLAVELIAKALRGQGRYSEAYLLLSEES